MDDVRSKTIENVIMTMRRKYISNFSFLIVASLIASIGCGTPSVTELTSSNKNEFVVAFFQLNDIYEIGPLENGKVGGMARAATVLRELKKENPNTYGVVAGDFLSPSVVGTVKHEGKRIAGAQMVDVLNAMGIDLVTFGNHEFDIKESDLQQRIEESRFAWIGGNVKHAIGEDVVPFVKHEKGNVIPIPKAAVLNCTNSFGNEIKIGVISVTLPANKASYVHYDDVIESAKTEFDRLLPSVEFIVALTHLSIEGDRELARRIPGLRLIMGGHEHVNMRIPEGEVMITKADANAKSAYIHVLRYNVSTKSLTMFNQLKVIDSHTDEDPTIKGIVKKWTDIAYDGFRAQGFDPEEVVASIDEPLDGREESIRNTQTNLTDFIAAAILHAAPQADAAIFNSGSIRIDDQIQGNLTQFDIIRILPFGGKILLVTLKGKLLRRVLETGLRNKGNGGFLQYANIKRRGEGSWEIKGTRIADDNEYQIAITDFLLTGLEMNMEFFTRTNPGIVSIAEPSETDSNDVRRDLRLAFIRYMQLK